jgi:putative transposase
MMSCINTETESASLAKELIAETCDRQNFQPNRLSLHTDRGFSMTSQLAEILRAGLVVNMAQLDLHVCSYNAIFEAWSLILKCLLLFNFRNSRAY